MLSDENLASVRALNEIADAVAVRPSRRWRWPGCCAIPASPRRCSARSSVAQLEQNVAALERADFSEGELDEIDRYAQEGGVNLWASSSSG